MDLGHGINIDDEALRAFCAEHGVHSGIRSSQKRGPSMQPEDRVRIRHLLTARSRNSLGYFLGAGIAPLFRAVDASTNPGAIQSCTPRSAITRSMRRSGTSHITATATKQPIATHKGAAVSVPMNQAAAMPTR